MRLPVWRVALLLAALVAPDVVASGQQLRANRITLSEGCTPLLDTSVPIPVTPKEPHTFAASFAGAPPRPDAYAWLRDDARNDTRVLSHLQEEEAYAAAVLAPTAGLQAHLLAEMKGRLPREESSAPQRRGRYWYYTVRTEGAQYRRFCRRPVTDPAAPPTEHDAVDLQQPEEVLLDQDELAGRLRRTPFLTAPPLDPAAVAAGRRPYFDMAGPEYSPDEQLAAYAVDGEGGEVYSLYVKNLTSGQLLLDASRDAGGPAAPFKSCAGHLAWMSDSRVLVFTTLTASTRRPDKVWWHDVAAAGGRPTLVFHEPDERFHLSLWRSRSGALVYLRGSSDTTQYLQYLSAGADLSSIGTAAANFTVLAPAVPERQVVVRDWPAPPSSSESGSGGGNSSSGSSGSGDGDSSSGSSSGNSTASGGPSGFIYAIVFSAEQRNGELVVASLRPNALPAPVAGNDSSGGASSSGTGADATAGSAPSSSGGGNATAPGAGASTANATEGSASNTSSGDPHWALLQAHNHQVELIDLTLSRGFLAVLERRNGTLVASSYALPEDGSPLRELPPPRRFSFEQPSYSLELGDQGPFDSALLRVLYSSLIHPDSTYDINMGTGNRVLKKQREVVGFDGSRYLARLLWAPSSGGVMVPVSVAYRGGAWAGLGQGDAVKLDGSDPLLLEAYGAYGASLDPAFSSARLSLLDRGFVYAIAHVRGGGEMGRYWWRDGKLLAKNHTFDDAAAAADFLIAAKYTGAGRVALWGRSAGGLTAAATINRRPGLFQACILDVPFVDVLTSMSDASLPLTVTEYEEWGDPAADQATYDNMLSYSPLDNVAPQPYPHLLLTGGLRDPRVPYWEPAKLAAKVRELKTSNDSLVLLRTNLAAGHFSDTSLDGRLGELSYKYAFLIQAVDPCATPSADEKAAAQGGTCRGCFPIFVAVLTTVALCTLAVVLNPRAPMGRRWRRLRGGGGGGSPGRGPLDGGEGDTTDEEGEDAGEGYDTRLYTSHLSDSQLAAAAAEAERQRAARQQQLEREGLSLSSYEAVRSAVRDRLLPQGPQSGPSGTPPPPPKRRLALGSGGGSPAGAGGGGGIELAPLGPAGTLSPVPESPTSMMSE